MKQFNEFRDDLLKTSFSPHLNSNIMINPNLKYENFDDILQNVYQKHVPEKREQNKHRLPNKRVSQMRTPLAIHRKPVGIQNKPPNVLHFLT